MELELEVALKILTVRVLGCMRQKPNLLPQAKEGIYWLAKLKSPSWMWLYPGSQKYVYGIKIIGLLWYFGLT